MKYAPTSPPKDPKDLPAYLAREFAKIQAAFVGVHTLDTLYAEPDRPQEGMIVKADGTSWNPGSGAGVYAYISSTWTKL